MPANSESPAPTVLATVTFGGKDCSAVLELNQCTPSDPWEITTCSMPLARRPAAASAWAAMEMIGASSASASSSVLGLINHGPAASPAQIGRASCREKVLI